MEAILLKATGGGVEGTVNLPESPIMAALPGSNASNPLPIITTAVPPPVVLSPATSQVQVGVRIRPLTPKEISSGSKQVTQSRR